MNAKQVIPEDMIYTLIHKCAQVGNITIEQMAGKTRLRAIVTYRQLAMFFLSSYTNMSLAKIGEILGGKDHATVLHSCKLVSELVKSDHKYKLDFDKIDTYAKSLITGAPEPPKTVDDFDYKRLADDRLSKIRLLEQSLLESTNKIQDLAIKLRGAEGMVRLYKVKFENANIPSRILLGE